MNVAVFASGGGSNFQALIDRAEAGDLHCTLALCVGNNSAAFAFERAKKHGIPTRHIAPSHFTNEQSYAEALLAVLREYRIDVIALAGYMKKIPHSVITTYPQKIINIHPGLLPGFGGKGLYGEKVHQAVLDYGAKISGITIHFVDEEYDHGPIIFQDTVKVLDSDDSHTLAERVLKVEHASYWRVLEALTQGRISVKGRRVYGAV
ncbi:MAG TPA: phosphoribosylglycinamide formyltransferase [Chitinivibrionales bacterium]|nr:phosphoribosylglycinamide formyltransferase [Chitinivibrionales bacterium]